MYNLYTQKKNSEEAKAKRRNEIKEKKLKERRSGMFLYFIIKESLPKLVSKYDDRMKTFVFDVGINVN